MVEVEVEDDGKGIEAEHLDKIFDPFFTTKEVGKGTGLGLAISYGIVTRHGGSIRVESQPGRGTRFRVQLPVKAPGS
jgi:signal transduction histidine kinase